MKPRLVLAALMPRDVVTRAREEFDAVVVEGKDDMTVEQVIEAASAHRADAIMFTNTLPLTADAIARLPASVRVGATSSVGYDHIDVAAAKARGMVVTNTPGVLTECTADFAFMMLLAAARRAYRLRQDHACRLALSDRPGRPAGRSGERQDARHSGAGAYRAGDGAAGARLRHDGGVSCAQPAAAGSGAGRAVFRIVPRDAAALRFSVAACAGGTGDGQDRQCRGAGEVEARARCW